ncbi:monovalent cation/H+ antiporter subunit D [Agrobacterium rubi]|uniref:Monovalent cation/H+ antiporter subunit D n=1 Tax=Agrobacterium rubi TaxID=28099 RepID=A0AAE7URG8_9HYPH|nr:monovalent cation/H+ antiporter subunit D [Agrobacterium rubi]NTE85367.1 monovalent cation/H+ antiporter subunit D [Agrobacterium rubi]NTF01299.1 monovalent cation/H+ antiporter subunit D [Agrobacterium rubi]NTF35486.1 monovalent cation/H+ antiporter subunit D [Agrobacterium rubi]OCJ48525.1 monovalent cation/H+ antiporter subunit D [Agrobacterium rubi]QTG00670.1 monovalent cation/H+ antiporter subunit D [Agrobacterium rubi]
MNFFPAHIVVAPILVPLITGAILLFIDERKRATKAAVSVISTFILLAVAIALFIEVNSTINTEVAAVISTGVYLLGNWPAPFGIVLVADRLSGLMVLLAALLAIPSLIYSLAKWHKAGAHFHSLFHLMLMGVNGAFLTGDLFNLFVFFEVMLAASYGLLLHGSGPLRVKAGLHYIAINLVAALFFLIGVSLIYGVTGTLNMGDLAQRIAGLNPDQRMLLETGAAVLGVAFLVKAGMWPLNFWLPSAYTAASAPVAAIFAIMSKVGIYVIARLSFLLFGETAGASAGFGHDALLVGGIATIVFGTIGVLASQALGRLAGFSVLVSSGTLLAAMGTGNPLVAAGALYYLISSTLTISAFFMLIELVERGQDAGANVLAVTMEAYGEGEEDEEEDEVGVTMPGTMAVLGVCFAACGILLAGLPPLSGFIAKFSMLSAILNPSGLGANDTVSTLSWWLVFLIVFSGLAALISMTRAGIRTFWGSLEGTVPRVLVIEIAPVLLLLAMTLAMTIAAGPVMRYLQETARIGSLPESYIQGVMSAPRADNGREAAP